jgi:hypothetical protein
MNKVVKMVQRYQTKCLSVMPEITGNVVKNKCKFWKKLKHVSTKEKNKIRTKNLNDSGMGKGCLSYNWVEYKIVSFEW